MSNNAISEILIIVLGIMMFILAVLVIIYIIVSHRAKSQKVNKTDIKQDKNSNPKQESKSETSEFGNQSVLNFMEFEKVDDNMIIQQKGKRFLMVVECQGVNYDLMSEPEKIGVEEGYQQFLNALRHPIQIYIQTRTVNLETSITTYKSILKEMEDKYRYEYNQLNIMRESGQSTEKQINKQILEVTKAKNMMDYSRDIINNTENMSKNKNVLSKRYYIIIPYFFEQANSDQYSNEEIKNMAFNELYTKAKSIIRVLASCSVKGKILDSNELAELIYVAFNRDESETYDLEKALNAGVTDLYSTAPDVFEKKINMLENQIRERAIDLANEKVDKVKSKTQIIAEEREKQQEDLIAEVAQIILEQNEDIIGPDVAEEAINEIEKEKEEKKEQREEVNNEK